MRDGSDWPSGAFAKLDPTPDTLFYAEPRFVTHIDEAATAAVTDMYREVLPPGGVILDLMSSWVSHLPEEVSFETVIGHGLNAQELAANPRLARFFVQDLNAQPTLPLETGSIDAVTACVSVQYLQQPLAILAEVARVLRPGGPVILTFSNRCFPTKAVAVWRALPHAEHTRLVKVYLEQAGFARIETATLIADDGSSDPLSAVIGWTSET